MGMGIIPCPKTLSGLEAICVTLPGVRGETFRFSCVIQNKKQNIGWCLQPCETLSTCVRVLRAIFFKHDLAMQKCVQRAAAESCKRMAGGCVTVLQGKGKRK